jgi:hypothetical protein
MQIAFSIITFSARPGYLKEISRPLGATCCSSFKYGFKEELAHHFHNDPALGGYTMLLKFT